MRFFFLFIVCFGFYANFLQFFEKKLVFFHLCCSRHEDVGKKKTDFSSPPRTGARRKSCRHPQAVGRRGIALVPTVRSTLLTTNDDNPVIQNLTVSWSDWKHSCKESEAGKQNLVFRNRRVLRRVSKNHTSSPNELSLKRNPSEKMRTLFRINDGHLIGFFLRPKTV